LSQATLVRRVPIQKIAKSLLRGLVLYGISIVVALLVNSLFIAASGGNIIDAYSKIFSSSFGSWIGFGQTLNKWTPLLLGALAVALGNRGGVYNIGVDGQIYIGAVFATGLGFLLADVPIPAPLIVFLVLLAGFIGGGMYAGIAGYLRAVYNVNEIFTTVMMNFVAVFIVEYLATGPWNDPIAGEAITLPIISSAHLPSLIPRTGSHLGILFALLMVFGIWFLLNKTRLGFHIRAVGDNPVASEVGGVNIRTSIFLTLALSGAIAGLAGAVEVIGVHGGRLILGLTPNYGSLAILISAVGMASPTIILGWSAFFAVFFVGSDSLQRSISFPAAGVLVFQAVMFLIIMWIRLLHERGSLAFLGEKS